MRATEKLKPTTCRGTAFVLCVIFVILSSKTGEAIKCFNCNSISTKECVDPMDWARVTYTECALDNVNMLIKRASHGLEEKIGDIMQGVFTLNTPVFLHDVKFACQKMDVVGPDGNVFNIRSCSVVQEHSNGSCDALAKMSQDTIKITFCGLCDDNLCNSGKYCTVSILVISALVLFNLVFIF